MATEVQTPTEKEPTTIRAVLERVVWSNERRIIGIAQPHNRREISVIGDMIEPKTGQLYEFSGHWKHNERYGKFDLHFYSYRTVLPTDSQGIYHYLVRVAKWVGPETAETLIERYGAEALDILKNDPERVTRDQIRGLTPERVLELTDTLKANEKLEGAMIEVGNLLGGLLGQASVEKAIRKWGADAAHIIRHDPYRLAELDGIGFLKADTIYFKLERNPDAARRHAHALLHVLQEQAAKSGHTRVTQLRILTELAKLIGEPHKRTFQLCDRAGLTTRTDGFVADADLDDAEHFVANKLTGLVLQVLRPLRVTDEIKELTQTLEDDQLNAFNQACELPVLVITGAPGTGKTYTVARIIALWQANRLNIALAAPTGKAAKQMEMALSAIAGLPARTIHSLLEAEVLDGEFGFQRNETHQLDCTALVIDETSMVDIRLMRSLLKAVPNECRVLLVGDHYQLPSVGPGATLRDILRANLPSVELRKIKRNAGRIVHACHAIKDGRIPEPAAKLDLSAGDNWRHIESSTHEHTLDVVRVLLSKKLPELGIDPVWQTQLISPTNQAGPLSCKVLNRIAKEIVNPSPLASKLDFALNDKVVRTKNGAVSTAGDALCAICHGTGQGTVRTDQKCLACAGRGRIAQGGEVRIVNGDLGVVREIDAKNIRVDFLYPDRSVRIPRKEHHLRMAYCLTCHKMQGSEVDVVIVPVHKSTMNLPMVTREWLYTALSRAKKFVLTIGNLDYLPGVLSRIGNETRTTGLCEYLNACRQ